MNPKNHKIFLDEISEKVGVHPNLVKDFVNFYYSEIRRSLGDLTYPYINIDNLGVFSLRKGKLDNDVIKYRKFIEALDLNTIKGYEKKVSAQSRLENLERAQKEFEQILSEKRTFKKMQDESKKNI